MIRSIVYRLSAVCVLLALPALGAAQQVPDTQVAEDEQLFRSTLTGMQYKLSIFLVHLQTIFEQADFSHQGKRNAGLLHDMRNMTFFERQFSANGIVLLIKCPTSHENA